MQRRLHLRPDTPPLELEPGDYLARHAGEHRHTPAGNQSPAPGRGGRRGGEKRSPGRTRRRARAQGTRRQRAGPPVSQRARPGLRRGERRPSGPRIIAPRPLPFSPARPVGLLPRSTRRHKRALLEAAIASRRFQKRRFARPAPPGARLAAFLHVRQPPSAGPPRPPPESFPPGALGKALQLQSSFLPPSFLPQRRSCLPHLPPALSQGCKSLQTRRLG